MRLSIIVPGIRTELWVELYNSIVDSCAGMSYELIFAGPNHLPSEFDHRTGVKHVKDFGSPSRALQMASLLAEGEYITYTSDDCLARENALKNLMENVPTDIVSVQYSESSGRSGAAHPIEYYNAWYHNDLQCKWVKKDWKIPIIFLMKTALFYEYGGLDCRFEHINMNLHDMAFRMQNDGKTVSVSDEVVWDADYVHRNESDPVINAFVNNDKPLFDSIWDEEEWDRPDKIDLNNWKDSPAVWKRRYEVV